MSKKHQWLTLEPETLTKIKIYCLTHGYKSANELIGDIVADFVSSEIDKKKINVRNEHQQELDELIKELY
jgi:hypothetical protein